MGNQEADVDKLSSSFTVTYGYRKSGAMGQSGAIRPAGTGTSAVSHSKQRLGSQKLHFGTKWRNPAFGLASAVLGLQ